MSALQLEDLLGRHKALRARDGRREAVQQRRLARLGAPGDDDVETGEDARVEERRGRVVDGAEVHEVVEAVRLGDELADVDGCEVAADAFEHDVQPVSAGKHRVDERLADVEPAPGRRQHPLHQLAHLRRGEHRGRELVPAVAGDEHPVGLVDPDLLDRRVVEVGLQRPEPGEIGHDLADDEVGLVDGAHDSGEAAPLVLGDDVERQAAYRSGIVTWVDASFANELADALGQRRRLRIHPPMAFPPKSDGAILPHHIG